MLSFEGVSFARWEPTLGETTGTRATGSFSATFTDGGNTKTVTDGLFDVALTVSTLPGV